MLEQIDREHPRSLEAKKILVELFGQLGEIEMRTMAAVGLFESAPTPLQFEKALNEARVLKKERNLVSGYEKLLELVIRMEVAQLMGWRCALF